MAYNNFTNPTSDKSKNTPPPEDNGTNNGGNNEDNGQPRVIVIAPSRNSNGTGEENSLDSLLINYNDLFKDATPIKFRDEIIEQTLSILIGKNKPNALYIGSAGVGKTCIVEDIARRLENDDPLIPDALKGYTIYSLPLQNIVSGSTLVGMVEQKMQAVIEFASDPKNKAILFIDEIHLMLSARHYTDIAEILKPALARGEIKVIGSTTLQESKDFMDNPAFNRRFTRVIVDELSKSQTIEILKDIKPSYYNHYNKQVQFKDDILEALVAIADDYHLAGNHRPDTAITLMDRAIADTILFYKTAEQEMTTQKLLAKTAEDRQRAQDTIDAIHSMPFFRLTVEQIKKTAIRMMTGTSSKTELDIEALERDLSYIKGQDEALAEICNAVERNDFELFPHKKPLTFLLVGPSGVGKTEIAKVLGKDLTSSPIITLNMTEFSGEDSINKIVGSVVGFIGSDSNAELPFDSLASNPYAVILLDELEKAHKSVQRLFMQAFDEGYIKSNRNGQVIDFSKAIIIATSNAAHKEVKNPLGFNTEDAKTSYKSEVKELSKWFDNELLNRFDHIIQMNELNEDIYREIIVDTYEREVTRIKAEKRTLKLPDKIPDKDLDEIVKRTYVPSFGARPANKAVREYIENFMLKAKRMASTNYYNGSILPENAIVESDSTYLIDDTTSASPIESEPNDKDSDT